MGRHWHSFGPCGLWLPSPAWKDRQHRDVHIGALNGEFFHQNRRARWDVVLEDSLSGPLVWIYRLSARVVLIDPDNVSKVATFPGDELRETLDDEVALAAVTGFAAQGKPRPPSDGGRDAGL